jgi:hypothetical protein
MHGHGMSTVTSLLGHLSQMIQRQVTNSISSTTTTVGPPTLHDIPQLVDQMLHSKNVIKRAEAVKRIYELCDVAHKHNRVPMVCGAGGGSPGNSKDNVLLLPALAQCLAKTDCNTNYIRHLSCLALNNLSIPPENKAVLSLGPASKEIIAGLCQIIAEDTPQLSYLGCIVLMNLSFFESSSLLQQHIHHSPLNNANDETGGGKSLNNSPPLDCSPDDSLLCVLEKFLTNNTKSLALTVAAAAAIMPIQSDTTSGSLPLLAAENNADHDASSSSSHHLRVCWACGLIKNLAKNKENAALMGQTNIPQCLVDIIRQSSSSSCSTRPSSSTSSCWTNNGLEFFCLHAILNLAQWPSSSSSSSREALLQAGAMNAMTPLLIEFADDSWQSLQATMVCAFLDAPWDDTYPVGGHAAAKCVFELVTNIVEKKGKEGQYDVGFFKLSTATMAYRDLARAAIKADRSISDESTSSSNNNNTNCIKVLAFPLAVALILQIISDVVTLSIVGPKVGGDALHHDDSMISAEYAVEALEAMLPAILQQEEEEEAVANDAAEPPSPPPRCNTSSSIQTIENNTAAGSEISLMLLKYANMADTSSNAKAVALQAATKIKQELSGSRPILEISHELWTQYRKKQGQPLALFTQRR